MPPAGFPAAQRTVHRVDERDTCPPSASSVSQAAHASEKEIEMKRIASAAVLASILAAPALLGAQDVEKGKTVYAANKCQTCHAIEGKGNKKFPLDGVGAKLSAEDITKWIITPAEMEAKLAEKPKIKMKAYKLPDEDLNALVAYMQSLK
jgi:mono/diheme cytochrome c family protein